MELMPPEQAASILSRILQERKLVALVGSYASGSSSDNNRTYSGLPTPKQFIELVSNECSYINTDFDFNRVCDEIVAKENRAKLEQLLIKFYDAPEKLIEPSPIHNIISWLPFSSYITSNYDEQIERALKKEKRKPFSIIDNKDIIRLKPEHTPVIKFHGCVSRPDSMVAASCDYRQLEEKNHLVQAHLVSSLANKDILVIGHGLGDSDLSNILRRIHLSLKDYTPKIWVVREEGHSGSLPGFDHPYTVIAEDLTQFLHRLLHDSKHRSKSSSSQQSYLNEAWLSSIFFAELKKAMVLPSETQVIDAFLKHLKEEICTRSGVESVLSEAGEAVNIALKDRPNYRALRTCWNEVEILLRREQITPLDAETLLNKYIFKRELIINKFKTLGTEIIKANDRILIYSQSQRVLQTLIGAPVNIQKTVHLFIMECRPKSPSPFQDSLSICESLADTHYKVTICPDVIGLNLLAKNQIEKVIMGTHAVYTEEEGNLSKIHSYVNTCGSLPITNIAQLHKVPVHIMGEHMKLECVPVDQANDHLYVHQEDDLLINTSGVRELKTKSDDVHYLNIGYDLVSTDENIQVYLPS